jgi:hypothetical protein
LARTGGLRKGLTQKEGVDLLAMLSSPEIYRLLVTRSGWSPAEYETWLLMTFEAFILGTPLRPILPPARRAAQLKRG